MTKKNLKLRTDQNAVPFLLEPVCKETIWGGNKLKEKYGKASVLENIAEAWECSLHPQGLSKVASGKYKGMYLRDVLLKHPEYLGNKIKNIEDFPILIKFIDAKDKLSVQVHPDDMYAKNNEHGSLGKTELWYIVEADDNAELVYGFYDDISREQLAEGINNGDIEKYLRRVKTKTNDVFFIPAGTVHGIGAGNLIVEVQENSDITYRLYDYDRVDSNGKKRELHIDKALDVIDYKKSDEIRQPMRVLRYQQGIAKELLCKCKYFVVERLIINTNDAIKLNLENDSYNIFVCIKGEGSIQSNNTLCLKQGYSVFVPASISRLSICGDLILLKIM